MKKPDFFTYQGKSLELPVIATKYRLDLTQLPGLTSPDPLNLIKARSGH